MSSPQHPGTRGRAPKLPGHLPPADVHECADLDRRWPLAGSRCSGRAVRLPSKSLPLRPTSVATRDPRRLPPAAERADRKRPRPAARARCPRRRRHRPLSGGPQRVARSDPHRDRPATGRRRRSPGARRRCIDRARDDEADVEAGGGVDEACLVRAPERGRGLGTIRVGRIGVGVRVEMQDRAPFAAHA